MDGDRHRDWLIIFLKGLCMGAADTIPGVSGGTIALITGIYERLVTAITELNPSIILYLPRLYNSTRRAQFRQEFINMDGPFLVILAIGIGTAVAGLSSIMHHAVSTPLFAVPTFAFFFGLILASAFVLYQYVAVKTTKGVIIAILGVLIAALLAGSGANSVSGNPSLPIVFFAGSIAVAAMILPGISGAFILLLLGLYTYMSGIPSGFLIALIEVATGSDPKILVEPGLPLLVFLSGAVIGLLTISHAVRLALEYYRSATLIFLIALMIGALRAPINRIQSIHLKWSIPIIIFTICACVSGALIVVILDRHTEDFDYS